MDKHHGEKLGMKPSRIDRVLYYIIKEGIFKGLSDAYVDDIPSAGDSEFREISNNTNRWFQMQPDPHLQTELTGFMLEKTNKANSLLNRHTSSKSSSVYLQTIHSPDFDLIA